MLKGHEGQTVSFKEFILELDPVQPQCMQETLHSVHEQYDGDRHQHEKGEPENDYDKGQRKAFGVGNCISENHIQKHF